MVNRDSCAVAEAAENISFLDADLHRYLGHKLTLGLVAFERMSG